MYFVAFFAQNWQDEPTWNQQYKLLTTALLIMLRPFRKKYHALSAPQTQPCGCRQV